MQQEEKTQEVRSKRNLIVYLIFAVTLAVIGILVADTSGVFCNGGCAVIGCHPSNPCTYKGKQYTAGVMCNPAADTIPCDVGIVRDCYCKTVIVGGTPNTLDCVCQ